MSDTELFDTIVGLLVDTARAHHAATGGVNPQWARWYSEHVVDDLNEALGTEMSVDQLEEWLEAADVRYRTEEQSHSWPKAYAAWLIAENQ